MTDQIPPVPAPEGTPVTPAAPAAGTPAAPYAQPAYSAVPAASTWNVLAIVSLIIAIVGFAWLSLGAVITGHIALGQIKRNPQQGRGLALAGTIVGYVGILVTIIYVIVIIGFGILAATSGYNNY